MKELILQIPLGSELLRFLAILMPQETHYLNAELENALSVVDMGCGDYSPLAYSDSGGRYFIGIDLSVEYIRKSKRRQIHSDYVKSHICTPSVRDRSVDTVLALDVIEHLPKADGYKLIQEMERLARRKVVIVTPNGFSPKAELEDGNPLQSHRSGWVLEDFVNLGYDVTGVFGLRCLRAERSSPRLKPAWLGLLVSWSTQKFVENRPRLAYSLMCVKNIDSWQNSTSCEHNSDLDSRCNPRPSRIYVWWGASDLRESA
jgi:hypothetical protein